MKYNNHKYIYTKPFGYPRHHWELIGQNGAVHFHVSIPPNYEPTAGLEFHSVKPRGEDAPDHVNCPLTGGRCWHDGMSLYAMETLWPMIKHELAAGNHEAIFHLLEHELSERLEGGAE